MSARQVRTVRGAAASAIATLLAAVSHSLAGGAPPAPIIVLAMAVLLTPAAMALLARRPSVVRLSTTVLSTQAAFHIVFFALGSPTGITGVAHSHGTQAVLGDAAPSVIPDAPMLVAHAAAAAVTIALFARGERLIAAVASWTASVLRRPVTPCVPATARLRTAVPWPHPAVSARQSSAVSLRGPPAPLGV